MADQKHYEVYFPLYKVGDDLGSAWLAESAKLKGVDKPTREETRTAIRPLLPPHAGGFPEASADAFRSYADQLDEAAKLARRLAGLAKERGLIISNADTHHVSVLVDPELGEQLVVEGVIHHDPCAEDYEDMDGEIEDEDEDEDGDPQPSGDR